MPLSNLISVADMISEISRQLGEQTDLEIVGGPIERAINDAYNLTVLEYKHAEFESVIPHFFRGEVIFGADATNTAIGDVTFTTTDTGVPSVADPTGQRWVDGAFKPSSGAEGLCFTITKVEVNTPIGGTHTITVAPEVGILMTGVAFTLVRRRFPLPVDAAGKTAFFIYDLSDVTNNVPIKYADIRLYDRGVPLIGQPIYYFRVKNDIYFYPAPFRLSGFTVQRQPELRLRYALRPGYKDTTDTLTPLPEEWQQVVMLRAYARMLDLENAHERAAAIKAEANSVAEALLKPWIEEVEDGEPSFRVMKDRWTYWG